MAKGAVQARKKRARAASKKRRHYSVFKTSKFSNKNKKKTTP